MKADIESTAPAVAEARSAEVQNPLAGLPSQHGTGQIGHQSHPDRALAARRVDPGSKVLRCEVEARPNAGRHREQSRGASASCHGPSLMQGRTPGELDRADQDSALEQGIDGWAYQPDGSLLPMPPQTTNLAVLIQGALTRQALRSARRVRVAIDASGWVTLDGQVHSWSERNAIEGAVRSAPGVAMVLNRLQLEP
jgi:hypothetical protein